MRWLVALLLLMSFAGCLGSEDEDPVLEPTHEDDHEDEPAMTEPENTTVAVTNAPPVAALSVNTTGLASTFLVNVTDEDGDPVTWTLDVDGNGTITEGTGNGTVEHTFAAGNYTATLTASDGIDEVTVSVDIQAIAPAPGAPGQNEGGSWAASVGAPGCFADVVGFGYPGPVDGLLYASFAIDPATWGYRYEVTVTSGTAQDSPGFTFLDADGGILLGGFLGDVGTGNVPEGAATGAWWTCLGAAMEGTYVSTP